MLWGVRGEERGGGVVGGGGYCFILRRWRGCLGVQKSVLDTHLVMSTG